MKKKKPRYYQTGGYNYELPERDIMLENYWADIYNTPQEMSTPRGGESNMGQNSVGESESAYGDMGSGFLNALYAQNYAQGYQYGKEKQIQDEQEVAGAEAEQKTVDEVTGPDPNENNNILPGSSEAWERAMTLNDMKGDYDSQFEDVNNQLSQINELLTSFIITMDAVNDHSQPVSPEEGANIDYGMIGYGDGSSTGGTGTTDNPAGAGGPIVNSRKAVVLPDGSLDFSGSLAAVENSGFTTMVPHDKNDPNSAVGPLGFKKHGHSYDYFHGEGLFKGANTQKYRVRFQDYERWWNTLQTDPDLANEVASDYSKQLIQIAGGKPARAAALNLGGVKGMEAYDKGDYEYRPSKKDMSLREYIGGAGLSDLRQSGGRTPVLNSRHDKYVGLNNLNIGNSAFIPNKGYQQYRGTDDGKPVELRDVVGHNYTLFGPNDTAWLYGNVYEERVL